MFFGVSRFAEMQALKAEDLTIGNGHAVALIRKQNNDPLGAGMRCIIPQFPLLAGACPVQLLQDWLAVRARLWPDHPDGPLFSVTHKTVPSSISADTTRKSLSSVFPGRSTGTHSLREGGAHWWKADGQVPGEIIQAQGGWSSPETMRSVYTRFNEQERLRMFAQAAACVGAESAGTLAFSQRTPAPSPEQGQPSAAPMPQWRRLAHTP